MALCIALSALGAGPAAAAVSLGDGSYDIKFSATEAALGNVSFVGSLDSEVTADLGDPQGSILAPRALLNSDLSLRLSINAQGANGFSYPLEGTFELTGIDLLVDGKPAVIKSVNFDPGKTDIGQWASAAQFIAPKISYSPTSATITFGFTGEQLAADPVDVYFNVSAVSAVPEPAEWAMLVAGIPLMVWLARRRRIPSGATS